MFDPTVYENIKVVIEGAIYDLDLAGVILVTNRVDRVELSTMSRFYSIQFKEAEAATEAEAQPSVIAELRIIAELDDLRAEILEQDDLRPGCYMNICFYTEIFEPEVECHRINETLLKIWQNRPSITQKLSFMYGDDKNSYQNEIVLDFGRKIDEEQIEDIKPIVDLMHHSIQVLNEFMRKR